MSPACVMPTHAAPVATAPGALLCASHRHVLADALAELPPLHHRLGDILGGGATTNSAGRVSGTPIARLPLNLGATEVRAGIVAALASWARVLVEDRDLSPPADAEPDTCAALLARWTSWLATQPYVDELLLELGDLRIRALLLLDLPRVRRRIRLGACPRCGAELLAVLHERRDGLIDTIVSCDGADEQHTYEPWQWARLGERLAAQAGRIGG
jgi:hypothetical protein